MADPNASERVTPDPINARTSTPPQQYANSAALGLIVIGLIALVVGAFIAWNGYQSATSTAEMADALGALSNPDWAPVWVGVGIAGFGALLLLIRWVIAAARR